MRCRSKTFELGKYEVTFEEYDRFTAATGRNASRRRRAGAEAVVR